MKISFSIDDVITATGLGRTKVYALIGTGKLKARKIGKRTVILKNDLEDFFASLEPYPTQDQKNGGAQ